MLNKLNQLLGMSIEDIISSTHTLTLLKVYSELYLNGAAPRTCEASLRKYYFQLKKDYQMKKEIIKRTCVPKFEGRRYIPGVFKDNILVGGHLHISGKDLTDAKAIELLNIGVLQVSDFISLPDGYEKPEVKEVIKPELVKYSKEEILIIIENDDYNEIFEAAKELGLVQRKVKKESIIEKINEYISK